MDKIKIAIIAVTLLVLFIVGFFVIRFVSSALFTATEAIKSMGEAPLPTETVEEIWQAPEMGINVLDYEAGIERVDQEYDTDSEPKSEPDADEDLQSVPIIQTPDELAGTSSDEPLTDPE